MGDGGKNAISGPRSHISATVPDWSRETPSCFWDPGRKLLLSVRRYQHWKAKRGIFASMIRKLIAARHRFWTVITGADIPLNCRIGGGLVIPHPNGIVIHSDASIGVNCLIFQQVTIGARSRERTPVIEGHVDIGAGAKILGPVRVGAHAKIGANAVVIRDVPEFGVAVGIPAKLVDPAQPAQHLQNEA